MVILTKDSDKILKSYVGHTIKKVEIVTKDNESLIYLYFDEEICKISVKEKVFGFPLPIIHGTEIDIEPIIGKQEYSEITKEDIKGIYK